MERPYFHFGSEELRRNAKANWNSIATLRHLLAELDNRKSQPAEVLTQEIFERVRELSSKRTVQSTPDHTATLEKRLLELEIQNEALREELDKIVKDIFGSGVTRSGVSAIRYTGVLPNCPDFIWNVTREAWEAYRDEQLRVMGSGASLLHTKITNSLNEIARLRHV